MEFTQVLEALQDQMGKRHLMLSYQWDMQDMVSKVCTVIKDFGINVWMDIEGGVTGNIHEAMAQGIEGAALICPFMTAKYQTSKNCSHELNYANDRSVVIIPCMAQSRTDDGNIFRASSWLGIITAGKLWIDFKSDDHLDRRVMQLLTECCSQLYKSEKPIGKMQYVKDTSSKKPKANKSKLKSVTGKCANSFILPERARIGKSLHQALIPGDCIDIWGEYGEGYKFNFNLMTENMQNILHFDIRPQQRCLIMNTCLTGGWGAEIVEYTLVRRFENGEFDTDFHLKVICGKNEFSFEVNGEQLKTTFPYRAPLSSAVEILFNNAKEQKRWSMVQLPAKRASLIPQTKDYQDIVNNEAVILEEVLKFGDCFEVWGIYEASSRFSLNIMRSEADYLLHFEVRPESNTVVIDTCLDGKWFGATTLLEAFQCLASSEKNFHIKVYFEEEGMKCSINEVDINHNIPYLFDLSTATHLLCLVENGESRWKKIKLPKPCQQLETFRQYDLENLATGDVINVTGIVRKNVPTTAFNILQDQNNIILHVNPRIPSGVIVLNSTINGGWGNELVTDIPNEMMNCGIYDIFITVGDEGFTLEFSKDGLNDEVFLTIHYPHRSDFKKAKFVAFMEHGGDVWTELYLPDGSSFCRSVHIEFDENNNICGESGVL